MNPQSSTTNFYHLPKNTGSQDLTKSSAPIPPVSPTDVLLKIHAVSLNYRDLIIADGTYGLGFKQDVVPCSDGAGEIVAIGSAVPKNKWKISDRVCPNFSLDHLHGDTNADIQKTALGGATDGLLTQYKVVPAHSLVKFPRGYSYEEAATLPCAALTAYNALMGPLPVKAGDVVLVQGTGGVSIFALQLAHAAGATVIATSSSNDKLEIAKKLGATHLINYKNTPEWGAEALKLTGGRGVDHVIEVGGPGTLDQSFNALRWGGWVHTIGFVAGGDEPKGVAFKCLGKQACLRGILIGSVDLFEDMVRSIEANSLKPVVDKVFTFDEAKEAYEHLKSQKHVGKVVIKVSED